jgi:RNA polymerase sigma factor for flagellar operon FliA
MGTKQRDQLKWDDRSAREALDRYESVVRSTARRLKPSAAYGQALDEEDLHAEGRIAVLEALDSYQGYGIAEQTWVRTRIKQRMIDAIRRLDIRSRREVRILASRTENHEGSDEEAEREREIAARRLVSFDANPSDSEPLSNRIADGQEPMPDDAAYMRSKKKRLLDAFQALPPRQRSAIQLGFVDGLALREVGDRMGISESRVCQLQKRAVQHLQSACQSIIPAALAA